MSGYKTMRIFFIIAVIIYYIAKAVINYLKNSNQNSHKDQNSYEDQDSYMIQSTTFFDKEGNVIGERDVPVQVEKKKIFPINKRTSSVNSKINNNSSNKIYTQATPTKTTQQSYRQKLEAIKKENVVSETKENLLKKEKFANCAKKSVKNYKIKNILSDRDSIKRAIITREILDPKF